MRANKHSGRMKKGLLLLSWLFVIPRLEGATALPDIIVPITGTIIESSPCKIVDSHVDLGKVMISRINGVNYTKKFELSLHCNADTLLRVQFVGQPHPAIPDAWEPILGSNQKVLGYRLMADGVVIRPNDWLKFNYPNVPVFTAVPVKVPGAKIDAGGYLAMSISVVVDYQ